MDIQAAGQGASPQAAASDGTPAVAVAPSQAAPESAAPAHDDHRQPLTATVAKLFAGGAAPDAHPVQVSYRVEGSDIVTVFTDPKTGKEIAQFPSEMMIQFAQFFAKESGVTLDRSA